LVLAYHLAVSLVCNKNITLQCSYNASNVTKKTVIFAINPLDSKGNYSATLNNASSYTGRWWVGCYNWYNEERPGRAAAPPSPLLIVPNVTAHPSTANVPIWLWSFALRF